MSRKDIVIGNLETYIKHHLETKLEETYNEAKHGSFSVQQQTVYDGLTPIYGYAISNWNVGSVSEPSYDDLMVYTQEDVFKKRNLVEKFKNSSGFNDYITERQELKTKLPPANWDNYSLSEKIALAKSFLVDKNTRLSVLTVEEEKLASDFYHLKSSEEREKRWKLMLATTYNNFIDGKNVVTLFKTYKDSYIDGLDDFSAYLNGAFLVSGKIPTAGTLSDFKNNILQIL